MERYKTRSHKVQTRHFYVAPALLALAILTFYPVLYGFWLAFTDANQTQLGDQSFIGLDNFFEVFSAEGFLRVTCLHWFGLL